MFYNYFLVAVQNLRKQPVFSLIKILSLTLGLASSILVFMHVNYIQSSNKHIDNWENTYRLVSHLKVRETNTPYRTSATAEPYVPQLRLDYPDQIDRIAKIRGGNGIFSRGDESSQNSYTWAEPDAIYIFDLDMISGDPDSAITDPNTMIISETVAEKYFANEEPLGQILTIDNQADLRITGVFSDLPENTTQELEMLISIPTGTQIFGENFMSNNAWIGFGGSQAYLTINDPLTAEQLNNDLPNFIERNLPENMVAFGDEVGLGLSLQRIDDIYLNPLNNFGAAENSTTKNVLYGLMVFSLLILASSCINYMNLSLAQITQRTKEIGVRKTLGAKRSHIIWQFLIESLLLTALALLIAMPLVALLVPTYTNLTSTSFSFVDIFQTGFVAVLIALVVVTGSLAGVVPAFSLSQLQAVSVMKGANSLSRAGKLAKSTVTAVQFAISSALILLSIAIYLQTEHMRNTDPAFSRENLVILDSRFSQTDPEAFNYNALKNDLEQHPGVLSVGTSQFRPPYQAGITPWRLPSFPPGETITVARAGIGPNFIDTYEFEILAGRGFSEEHSTDFMPPAGEQPDPERTYGIVITDQLAERFGIESPQAAVGQLFETGNLNFQVIGVVRQFRFQGGMETGETSLGILLGSLDAMRFMHVRLDPNLTSEALEHIDAMWTRHRPDVPIDRTFFEQTFNTLIEARTGGLSTAALLASIITVVIAIFGLYALASYSSLRRTKEIGVRKVLGASAKSIVTLLAWDFVKPVLLACLISWPVAYYFISNFYAGFSSQANFPLYNYGFVTLGVVLLAILTVVVQCYRIANSDPVKSLRYE